ncbi:MAG: hypothetical protein WCQ99_17210, partial [Pseudomonadota bacterium]
GSGGGSGGGSSNTPPPENSLSLSKPVDFGIENMFESFTITNSSGINMLEWSLGNIIYHKGENWILGYGPKSGKTRSACQVMISIYRSGLSPGLYTAEIPVTSNSGSANLLVRMEVAKPEAPSPECTSDEDCNDGMYCNGQETCSSGVCAAGAQPCDENQKCDETQKQCFDIIHLAAENLIIKPRAPVFFEKIPQWLILHYTGDLTINDSQTMVSIEGDNETFHGIEVDHTKKCFQLSRYIFVPVFIYKDATLGSWSVIVLVQHSEA